MSLVDAIVKANLALCVAMVVLALGSLPYRHRGQVIAARSVVQLLRNALLTAAAVPLVLLGYAMLSGLRLVVLDVTTDFDGMLGRPLFWMSQTPGVAQFGLWVMLGSVCFGGAGLALDLRGLRRMASSARLKRRLGRIALREGPAEVQPCTFAGGGELTILLPRGLPAKHRRHVVAHELMHIRNGDLRWNWITAIAVCFCAWNPAFWIWRSWHRHHCELACDQRVIARRSVSPRAYSASLLDLAQRYSGNLRAIPLRFLGGGRRRGAILRRRIERLTISPPETAMQGARPVLMAAILLASLGLTSVQITVRPWSVAALSEDTIANLDRLSALDLSPPYGLVLDY